MIIQWSFGAYYTVIKIRNAKKVALVIMYLGPYIA